MVFEHGQADGWVGRHGGGRHVLAGGIDRNGCDVGRPGGSGTGMSDRMCRADIKDYHRGGGIGQHPSPTTGARMLVPIATGPMQRHIHAWSCHQTELPQMRLEIGVVFWSAHRHAFSCPRSFSVA